MQERELISIIKSHRADSLGADDGALSNERAEAMDRYHGRPLGNEIEGRSAVVSKDLSEAVEWALPAVMKVFTQSGNIGEFEPVGPEDEELAQQESDAINKVFMQDCNGFVVLYDAVKDAMLLKNGYIKHYWDVTEKQSEEEYAGLDINELTALFQALEADGATVTVKGQEQREEMLETPQGPQPMTVFDVRLAITRKEGKVVCEAVPTEEVRVSRKCRGSLQTSPFVEHVTRKTRSELIEMGMKRSFVDSLPAFEEHDKTGEKLARDSVDDESDDIASGVTDRSMDEIEFCEAYVLVDFDGDGRAERRKVVTVANQIPPGPEWNEVIDAVPMTGGVMKRVPHRHVGESLQDEIGELALIKTTLTRMALDNGYATLNDQIVVNERANLPDFLTSLPGGVKRIRGIEPVDGSFSVVPRASVIGDLLQMIGYVDQVKMARTGINESSTGMDADTLKESTKGAFLENMNRASQKIEMITRMLAETLVKPTLLQVHALMMKHQDKPKMMKLRGKFVPVNPQEWRERNDLVLKVGLGTGNQEDKQQKLMMAAQVQEKTAMLGLVGPTQGYNLAADLYKVLGFDMPEKYIINPDPQNPEWQQQQQQAGSKKDPLVQAEEVKAQAGLQKAQIDGQAKMAENEQAGAIERERMAAEMAFKEREMQAQAELERWKAQLKAETELQIAQMREQLVHEREMVNGQRMAEAASKPASVVQMGGDEMAGHIKTHMETQSGAVMQALGAISQTLDGLTQAIGQLAQKKPYRVRRGVDGRVEALE